MLLSESKTSNLNSAVAVPFQPIGCLNPINKIN